MHRIVTKWHTGEVERIWARKLESPDERKRNGAMRKVKYALIKGGLASAGEVIIAWSEGVVYVKEDLKSLAGLSNMSSLSCARQRLRS